MKGTSHGLRIPTIKGTPTDKELTIDKGHRRLDNHLSRAGIRVKGDTEALCLNLTTNFP
jgi:hypothetical protein